jgi:hypothetical protein
MFFKTSSLNRMVIDSSGAVGIGSTSPSQKLTISTTSSDDGIELISTNSGSVGPTFESYHNAGQGNAAANDFIFVQRAYGDNDKGSGFEKVEFGNTSFQASDVGDGTEDSKYRIGTIKNGTLATRFIIDGEAVGIGTESPSASRLHVQSPDALNSTASLVTIQNLETTDGHCQGLFVNAGQGSSDDSFRVQTRPGVEALRVKGDGAVSTAQTISQGSDIKLKENIKDLEKPLEKVNQLRGVSYNRIDLENKFQYGLIAQEVEKVIPELVTEEDGTKMLYYTSIIPFLVESIKELSAKVTELENKLGE